MTVITRQRFAVIALAPILTLTLMLTGLIISSGLSGCTSAQINSAQTATATAEMEVHKGLSISKLTVESIGRLANIAHNSGFLSEKDYIAFAGIYGKALDAQNKAIDAIESASKIAGDWYNIGTVQNALAQAAQKSADLVALAAKLGIK